MLTLMIDAHEGRNVGIFDVPGAFLQPEIPKKNGRVLLKLKVIMARIMCQFNIEYEKTLVKDNGKYVL